MFRQIARRFKLDVSGSFASSKSSKNLFETSKVCVKAPEKKKMLDQQQSPQGGHSTSKTPSCKVPSIKPDFVGDDRWLSMHHRYVQLAKSSEAEVLFIGDSIIQQMEFTPFWNDKINPLHCLNFGIGGDRVEHVLWRVLNGELDLSIPVKVVVLFVGTNNFDSDPQDVFEGICEIIRVIKDKLPNVTIIVPTLLPKGQYPNPYRKKNNEVNRLLLKRFQDESAVEASDAFAKNVHVVSIHEDIIQSDKTISHHIMYDYLHLTNEGYNKIFLPVYKKLLEVLRQN